MLYNSYEIHFHEVAVQCVRFTAFHLSCLCYET